MIKYVDAKKTETTAVARDLLQTNPNQMQQGQSTATQSDAHMPHRVVVLSDDTQK